MSGESSVLRARDLSVGYAGTPVCAPVDISVGAGQMLAIIGANGSGKSTLLRAFLGLLEPLAGTVEVLGREVDERERSFRAQVAGVLDADAYFPGLTTREHLVLTARGHAVRAAGSVVDDLLDQFGLTDHANAFPESLSSGQRRRLLLAAGFVRPRQILVLDEPEQRLDVRMRRTLVQMLREDAARGVSIVFATHDEELVRGTGASALLMADDACSVLSPADAVAALARGL
ncbi:ABC transporter [Sanguibacter gelidistatuariae]|uniref:ABC transporter n=1 Tax=Sanguibacter gelidistatuariae TaxID=1814289 RepID=A0A1G6NMU8_9MICO|nr:ABC transporter ATP-binding protein [Sanguibacter gelidistatuariae]SDC69223.1 ABC transporter [Sanguibacter gelidistatuariae]